MAVSVARVEFSQLLLLLSVVALIVFVVHFSWFLFRNGSEVLHPSEPLLFSGLTGKNIRAGGHAVRECQPSPGEKRKDPADRFVAIGSPWPGGSVYRRERINLRESE